MKKIIFLIGLIFLFNVLCINLYSSDVNLTELQKQEKERRKETPKSRLSVDNYNVASIDGHKEYHVCWVKIYPEIVYKKKEKSKDPKQTREYWQKLKKDIESQIEKVESKINDKKSELSRIFNNWLIMDLPDEKDKLKDQMWNLKTSLNKDRIKLERLLRAFEDLSEQGRKAGIPPGWLR